MRAFYREVDGRDSMLLPKALTRNVPVLVLESTSISSEDDILYMDFSFSVERGNHDESGLCICGARPPEGDHSPTRPSYTSTVSGGQWISGAISYCGVSNQELIIGWRTNAAKELMLPQLTVISFAAYHGQVSEIREGLHAILDWEMMDRPYLELDSTLGPASYASYHDIKEWSLRLGLAPSDRHLEGQLELFELN